MYRRHTVDTPSKAGTKNFPDAEATGRHTGTVAGPSGGLPDHSAAEADPYAEASAGAPEHLPPRCRLGTGDFSRV